MKLIQPIKSIVLILAICVCFTSCSKEDLNADANISGISVKLKSTGASLNKVYIEIEDVELRVKESNDPSAWVNLNAINRGTHNALDLRAGRELILVNNFEMESTRIYEIKLVLGDNNFIDLDGVLHSLDATTLGNATPSNVFNKELVKQHFYEFVINIDIDESISYNEDENMMILDPKLYTEIRQIQY